MSGQVSKRKSPGRDQLGTEKNKKFAIKTPFETLKIDR